MTVPHEPTETGDAISDILARLRALVDGLKLPGNVHLFGSSANGLKTPHSDCDVVYLVDPGVCVESFETYEGCDDTPVMVLQRFATDLEFHGFHSVVTIFQAAVPLLKAVHPSGIEIDLCVGNKLGFRNSRLLAAYCELDDRVVKLVHKVKHWASSFELIGSGDGHLSSYGLSLLTIFFFMHTVPPVLPNLQSLADRQTLLPDARGGYERLWDCSFWEQVELLPRSANEATLEELLIGFFDFYLKFDWSQCAVSVRLAQTQTSAGTVVLPCRTLRQLFLRVPDDQWYVEDPFDLSHNLAANCTAPGRRRFMDAMRQALDAMLQVRALEPVDASEAFEACCLTQLSRPRCYFLKCRVHPGRVSAEAFASAFSAFTVRSVHFPKCSGTSEERPEAFVEFDDDAQRKCAHTVNETYLHRWQLRLFVCCSHALEDARALRSYETLPGRSAAPAPQEEPPGSQGGEGWAGRGFRGHRALFQQLQRVKDGIRQSERFEELVVLSQRAKALGMKMELRTVDKKLKERDFRRRPGNASRGTRGTDTQVRRKQVDTSTDAVSSVTRKSGGTPQPKGPDVNWQ